eukprot:GEMP01020639.1.p1 GENE.GEMP01020639.1~~GEMP01020639.1.p1  ORF type:complete len:471 (+),score=114.47 GEMP01020639.1:165-1577(+)
MPGFNFQTSMSSGLLASGQGPAYVRPSSQDDAVRTWKTEPVDEDAQFDPVAAMKEGVQVLRYVAETRTFEWRFLKTDDRLNFLYILTKNCDIHKGVVKDFPFIKVDSILQILNEDNAVDVYDELKITDKQVTAQSANVIKYGPIGTSYSLDNTILLMAMPRVQLRRCIEAVIANAPNQEEELENAARYVQSHVRQRALRTSTKATASNVLANIRLKDSRVLFDVAQTSLAFELTFQQSTKAPIEITLSAASGDPEGDATTAAAEHHLNATDTARFVFTVEECLTQRRWLSQSSIIRLGLLTFALEPTYQATPLAMDDAFKELREEIGSLAKGQRGASEKEFAAATARAHFLALAQLCEFEEKYADLCIKSDSDETAMSIAQLQLAQEAKNLAVSKNESEGSTTDSKEPVIEDSIQRDMRELKASTDGQNSPKKKEAQKPIPENPEEKSNPCPCSGARKGEGPCVSDCGLQ